MKIAIIGTGVYGMAIALTLAKNNNEIMMWTESNERYEEFKSNHSISGILDGISIPSNINVTNSYEEALKDCNIVFIMSVASYVGSICKSINPYINKSTYICIASKGIENETCSFLSDIAFDNLCTRNIAVLSGPTFAIDIANNNPCGLSIASNSKKTINIFKKVLENDTLKLRETNDLIGVQICGSIKNVIAVAAGMLSGMGYPESTQAFLITESLHDIKSLISSLGGNKKTILSFAGVGDLLLTCTSTKSRNFSFGVIIGKGALKEEKDEYLNNHTVEGYYTLKSIYKLVRKKKISMPIIDLIYKIVLEDQDPQSLSDFLIKKQ